MGSFSERAWSPGPLEDNVHLTPMSRLGPRASWTQRSALVSTQTNLYRGCQGEVYFPTGLFPFHLSFLSKHPNPQTFWLPTLFTWAECKANKINSKLESQIYRKELWYECRGRGRKKEKKKRICAANMDNSQVTKHVRNKPTLNRSIRLKVLELIWMAVTLSTEGLSTPEGWECSLEESYFKQLPMCHIPQSLIHKYKYVTSSYFHIG